MSIVYPAWNFTSFSPPPAEIDSKAMAAHNSSWTSIHPSCRSQVFTKFFLCLVYVALHCKNAKTDVFFLKLKLPRPSSNSVSSERPIVPYLCQSYPVLLQILFISPQFTAQSVTFARNSSEIRLKIHKKHGTTSSSKRCTLKCPTQRARVAALRR